MRAWTAAAAFSMIACGGAPPPKVSAPPAPSAAPSVEDDKAALFAKFTALENEMCRCPVGDGACAQRVENEMTAFANEQKARPEPVLSADEEQRANDIAIELAGCMARAMGPASP